MQDARRKNRLAIGERHHGATLTDAEVADINYGDVFGKGINAFTPQPSLRQIGGDFGASRECT